MEHQVEKAKKNATEPQRILSKADVTRSWWLKQRHDKAGGDNQVLVAVVVQC